MMVLTVLMMIMMSFMMVMMSMVHGFFHVYHDNRHDCDGEVYNDNHDPRRGFSPAHNNCLPESRFLSKLVNQSNHPLLMVFVVMKKMMRTQNCQTIHGWRMQMMKKLMITMQ